MGVGWCLLIGSFGGLSNGYGLPVHHMDSH